MCFMIRYDCGYCYFGFRLIAAWWVLFSGLQLVATVTSCG